jgi:type IV pilus assembly protein PilA
MFTKLRERSQDEKGFTLIELLVVILIIGILAAIAIPSFLGQRDKANDSTAKTQAKTVQTALETWFTDNQTYDGATAAELKKIEPTLNDVTALADPIVGADSYTVAITNAKTNNVFRIVRASTGATTRTCTVASPSKPGGCKITSGSNGNW